MKRKALGKGLSALLPDPEPPVAPAANGARGPGGRLEPNPFQPRSAMDPARLDELAASLNESGMVQPILVRRHRRALPDHRRRAPLARGAEGRPGRGAHGRARGGRRPPAGAGPGREHPAPGADRRSRRRRPSSACTTSCASPRKTWRAAWAATVRRSPTRCACCGCRARSASSSIRRPRRRPWPRAARPGEGGGPGRAGPRGGAQGPVRARGRAPGGAPAGSRARAGRPRATPTPARPRSACGRRWARGWRSRGGARAGSSDRLHQRGGANRIFDLLVRRRPVAAGLRARGMVSSGAARPHARAGMIKIKGLAAEDLNGFMDEGTEFHGRAPLPPHLPDRRPDQGTHRVREHPHRRRVGPGGRRDRVRRRLDPGHGQRAASRAASASSSSPGPRCRPARLTAPRHRGGRVLPGRMRHEHRPGGGWCRGRWRRSAPATAPRRLAAARAQAANQ